MHIAIIVSKFPTTSETFIFQQVTGLIRAGHHVQVFTARPENSETAASMIGYLPPKTITYWGSKASRVTEIPPPTLLTPRRWMRRRRAVRELPLLISPRSFDAILCHFGTVGLMAVRLRAFGLIDGPIATIFHGNDVSAIPARLGTNCYAELLESGELFLPISQHWRDRLLSMGAPPDRTLVQHLGIDTDRIAFSPTKPRAQPFRLLTIARLVEKKGIEYALRAVQGLHRETHFRLHYDIVGTGPLEENLRRLSVELGLQDYVTFRGAMDHATTLNTLRSTDLFILPSVTGQDSDMEGIPVALMEAMASGAPVISTMHSGIPELVPKENHFCLAPEREPNHLKAILRELCADTESWSGIAKRNRNRIESVFSENAQLSLLEDRLQGIRSYVAG